MANTIVFVHGRGFKPRKTILSRLWSGAVRAGIRRTAPEKLRAYAAARKVYSYYGDLSGDFLSGLGQRYEEEPDVVDARRCLERLRRIPGNGFTRKAYDDLPGKNAFMESLAKRVSRTLHALGLTDAVAQTLTPDLVEYWNHDSSFASEVRWRFTCELRKAMNRRDRILVIAHSLGSLIAWDTFWKFSYYGEYHDYRKKMIDLWITIGSPLAAKIVIGKLKGAGATGARRYPINVRRWENLAAEDDFIPHGQRMSENFGGMENPPGSGHTTIQDHRIYNLAIRDKVSNPHTPTGYLVHPTTSALIANWL